MFVEFTAGLILGVFLGIGIGLVYLRWRMKKQIGNLEESMDAMMDLTSELDEEDIEEEKDE